MWLFSNLPVRQMLKLFGKTRIMTFCQGYRLRQWHRDCSSGVSIGSRSFGVITNEITAVQGCQFNSLRNNLQSRHGSGTATVSIVRAHTHTHTCPLSKKKLLTALVTVKLSGSDLQLAVRILVCDEPAVCTSSGCFQNSCSKTRHVEYC